MKIAAAELKTPAPVEAEEAEPAPEGFSTALAAILASTPTSLARVPTVRPAAGGWSLAETEPPPADFAPVGADGVPIELGDGATTMPAPLGVVESAAGAPAEALDGDPARADVTADLNAPDVNTPDAQAADVKAPDARTANLGAADVKATDVKTAGGGPAEPTTMGKDAATVDVNAEPARAETVERAASGGSASADAGSHAGASNDESSRERGERSGVHRVAESAPMDASEIIESVSDASGDGPRPDAHVLASSEPLREAPKDAPVATSPVRLPTEEAELPEGVKWSLLRDAAGQDHARVTLDHPTLGTLRLDFAMLDDGIDVRVLAPSLLSALRLESDEERIRELLEERGARLAALRVSIDRRPEPPRAAPQFPRRAQPGRISTEA